MKSSAAVSLKSQRAIVRAGNFSPRDARRDSALQLSQFRRDTLLRRTAVRSAMLMNAAGIRRISDGEGHLFPHALGGTNAATASSALRCLIASVRLIRFCKRRYPVRPHTHEKPWSIARSPLSLQ